MILHQMKINLIVVTARNVKILVNDSIYDSYLQPMVGINEDPLVDVVPIKKGKYVDGSLFFAFVYSFLLFILFLVNGVWLVVQQ